MMPRLEMPTVESLERAATAGDVKHEERVQDEIDAKNAEGFGLTVQDRANVEAVIRVIRSRLLYLYVRAKGEGEIEGYDATIKLVKAMK